MFYKLQTQDESSHRISNLGHNTTITYWETCKCTYRHLNGSRRMLLSIKYYIL